MTRIKMKVTQFCLFKFCIYFLWRHLADKRHPCILQLLWRWKWVAQLLEAVERVFGRVLSVVAIPSHKASGRSTVEPFRPATPFPMHCRCDFRRPWMDVNWPATTCQQYLPFFALCMVAGGEFFFLEVVCYAKKILLRKIFNLNQIQIFQI